MTALCPLREGTHHSFSLFLVHEPFAKMALRRRTRRSISTTISPSIIIGGSNVLLANTATRMRRRRFFFSIIGIGVSSRCVGCITCDLFHWNDGMSNNNRVAMAEALPTTTDVHEDVVKDSRGIVCLSNLDRIIDVDTKNMTVTVEAGARVSTVPDALRPHGLALPNLASIAEQQVGGFVSAGAHGTGALIPPVENSLHHLHLLHHRGWVL